MIYCILGNSAAGKDTLVDNLISDKSLQLYNPQLSFKRLPMVTTRPKRPGEDDSMYKFVSDETFFQEYYRSDRLIEYRDYTTANGDIWSYGTYIPYDLTFDNLNGQNFVVACSPSQYLKYCEYFKDNLNFIYPIILHCRDTIRLKRYVDRLSNDASRDEIAEAVRRIVDDKDYFNTDIDTPNVFSSECSAGELLKDVQEHIKTVFYYSYGDIKSANEVLKEYIKKELSKNESNTRRNNYE